METAIRVQIKVTVVRQLVLRPSFEVITSHHMQPHSQAPLPSFYHSVKRCVIKAGSYTLHTNSEKQPLFPSVHGIHCSV